MHEFFPVLNASLNAVCTVLLLCGWSAIRAKRITRHRNLMTAAFVVSMLFLSSYLYYHIIVKQGQSTLFTGQGIIRWIYFTILISHIILAAGIAFAAPVVLILAYAGRIDRHRRLARWVLPIWLYVSVTGVVVYWMLYRL